MYKMFLLFGLTFFFYSYFETFRGVEPGIAVLSGLFVLKSLELNTKRDYCLALLIAQLVIMANFTPC